MRIVFVHPNYHSGGAEIAETQTYILAGPPTRAPTPAPISSTT